MKVNKINRKLIKPHSPTPQNLKNYYISFVDKHMGPMNFAVVLFYDSKPQKYNLQLEESLSKTLVHFYPLAGRYIKNDHYVDCNDEGVEFIEAEALDVELIDLVAKIDTDQLNDLLPDQYFRIYEASHDPIMSIQATHFPCNGLAIAISVSHRVFDASSLETFIASWSNANNPDHNTVGLTITPSFHLPSLLPYKDHDFGVSSDQFSTEEDYTIIVKRFVFNEEALTRLRSKIKPISTNGYTISRVRVVCAVITKAMINLDRAKHSISRDFVITQPINMRERTIPPQPKHACGNFSIPSLTRCVAAEEAKEIGIQELVDVIGEDVRNCIADYAEIVSPDRDGRDTIIKTINLIKEAWMLGKHVVIFSDWSKFGFYKADFGFGKPIWTSIGPQRRFSGTTLLMSDREGDGIEAWVHLNQDDMHLFEQDEGPMGHGCKNRSRRQPRRSAAWTRSEYGEIGCFGRADANI
ncbi:hypothetical protein C2S53_017385 [Perilla frutescens var. hirtella]|uniref:Uncharacterized protein n=1 Tax=Perilla frutescens var. hirtella TaxID=608512 RepID=A0AAD4ITG9_PERFH|nr:hypothetical protein C2S51_020789 [Perilla frutescens var. frutescens]KAH6821255.1 hypothetical protein C2S53_017385 [Perilla frutescens var. hirtella]